MTSWWIPLSFNDIFKISVKRSLSFYRIFLLDDLINNKSINQGPLKEVNLNQWTRLKRPHTITQFETIYIWNLLWIKYWEWRCKVNWLDRFNLTVINFTAREEISKHFEPGNMWELERFEVLTATAQARPKKQNH